MLPRTASGPTGFSQRIISAKRVGMAQFDEMQTNAAKLGEFAESTGRNHDCVFEEQVAKALQARGYQVLCQVDLAGFFIDFAVPSVDRPVLYPLGIECNGASHHDVRFARDRDWSRHSVLESHGSTIPPRMEHRLGSAAEPADRSRRRPH